MMQLPPLLPYPGDTASDEAMKAYVDRAWLVTIIERLTAQDAELKEHRKAIIAVNERGHDGLAFAAVFEGAMKLMADRTSSATSEATAAKEAAESVRDAFAVADLVAAGLAERAADPPPATDPAQPPGETPGISG